MDLPTALSSARAGDRRAHRVGIIQSYTVGEQTAYVTVDGATVVLPILEGTYAVGDSVLVSRDGLTAGYVVGRIGTPAAPEEEPTTPPDSEPATSSAQSRVVLPESTGTYRSGWRSTTDLYQGDYNGAWGLNTGAAFYGRRLAALDVDLTRPYRAVLRYSRARGGVYAAQTPTVWTLAEKSRPAGAPTRLTSSTATGVAVGHKAEWELPGSMTAELLGGDAGGLGIYVPTDDPYIVLNGLSGDGQAFALELDYYA